MKRLFVTQYSQKRCFSNVDPCSALLAKRLLLSALRADHVRGGAGEKHARVAAAACTFSHGSATDPNFSEIVTAPALLCGEPLFFLSICF